MTSLHSVAHGCASSRKDDLPPHLADLPERQKTLENYKLGDLEKFVQAQTEITLRYPDLPHNQK